MLPMSSSVLDEPEAAHVVELPALRVEAAAGVGVVAGELLGRSAARVTPYDEQLAGSSSTWYCMVVAAEARESSATPWMERYFRLSTQSWMIFSSCGRPVGALEHVAVDQAARAEERRHVRA